MKKSLLLLLAFYTFSIAITQVNFGIPCMENFNTESRTTPLKLQDVVDATNNYWKLNNLI